MKKIFIFLLIFLLSINCYSQEIKYENFIVKRNTNTYRRDTYYLGQVKSKTEFYNFISNFNHEKIDLYDGFRNVIKVFDENIDLYFTENDVFTLIEIKVKTDEYELYKTKIKIGNHINDVLSNYIESFKNEGKYYYAEIEDFTNEFEELAFYNISIQVEEDIIKSIILYYSFVL